MPHRAIGWFLVPIGLFELAFALWLQEAGRAAFLWLGMTSVLLGVGAWGLGARAAASRRKDAGA